MFSGDSNILNRKINAAYKRFVAMLADELRDISTAEDIDRGIIK